jgi:hypothetical protein
MKHMASVLATLNEGIEMLLSDGNSRNISVQLSFQNK